MKVLICGGRDFNNVAYVYSRLDGLHAERQFTAMITGGARGVDTIANDWGKMHPDIRRYISKADWDRYGKRAGPLRNQRMLEWKPDLVIAFPGGAGTANMIRQAVAAGVEVVVMD